MIARDIAEEIVDAYADAPAVAVEVMDLGRSEAIVSVVDYAGSTTRFNITIREAA